MRPVLILLSLEGFDPTEAAVPWLVGLFLRANQQARDAYAAMQKDPSFL